MNKEHTIHVLDYDQSSRKGISRLLHMAGFNVLPFSDVISFLNKLNPKSSGTLVMDLEIPELLLEKLIKELKCHGPNCKIIIVSAKDDLVSKKIADDIGAIQFFRKPVDGTALIDSINWSLKNNKTEPQG
jgi:two-component system response regulator FixJ